MTSVSPNRQSLKDLAIFTIDAQFCQQYGSQILNYSGEITETYRQACRTLHKIVEDLLVILPQIQSAIPAGESE